MMRGGGQNDEGGYRMMRGKKYKMRKEVENNKKIYFIFSGSYLILQL